MSEFNRAIIALNNQEETKNFVTFLKSKDMDTFVARDGSELMEAALKSKPSIIITDLKLKVIDTFNVFKILLNNPNTADVPFAFFMDGAAEIHGFRPKIDIVQVRPYIMEDFYKKLRVSVLTAQSGGSGTMNDMTGSLAHMSLPDLIQILEVNKKEGHLVIREGTKVGHILMKDGDIYSITQGRYEGEKALYRLFAWEKGTFEFSPKAIFSEQKIMVPTSGLLMEGMRNLDEFGNHQEDWPEENVNLKVVKTLEEVPKPEKGELKPAVGETLKLMNFYPRLKDIIDNTTYTDLQIAENIMYLIDNEVIERVDGKSLDTMSIFEDDSDVSDDNFAGSEEEDDKGEADVITPNEAIRLKEYFVTKWSDMLSVSFGKIFVVASSASALKDFLYKLRFTPGFTLNSKLVNNWDSEDLYMGEVAKLSLYGGLDLTFFALPGADYSGPLIQALSPNLVGTLLVCDDDDEKTGSLNNAKEYINSIREVPTIHVYTGENTDRNEVNTKLTEHINFKDGDTLHLFNKEETPEITKNALGFYLKKMIETS